ncbi:SDR family NAD(P)-dependent oxidoreductase [Conexibacter sp. SYSU D00693]|uniref:SDR family NAD(P)-dependent oxidoreductase n=1 Tax=Conexibacter sp. SYSU D00693 TaxID=2812560 RepID=UPI00196B60E8|nr:SDR family NAD(P)-dependent oxidoreductase [Conexibacter sp. SYSU D00693]
MQDLAGRRALITGGARGIGRAVAELFVQRGATVMLADVNAKEVAATADALGDAAHATVCDVTDTDQVAAAVATTVRELGGLDVLVNNAGVEIVKPLLEMTEEEFRQINEVNVTGVFLGMKHALPALAETRGTIVNLASVAGLNGCPLLGAYCGTKAAVLQLTRTAAVELRDAGVRVNAVCPGFVDTAMVDRAAVAIEAALDASFPDLVAAKQGRLGTVAEVAETVAYLASDRAAWTTGSSYVLDGGLSASLL